MSKDSSMTVSDERVN